MSGRRVTAGRRHLLIAVVLAAAAAGAAVLAFALIIVPLLTQAPVILGHAYVDYWDGVSQQFQQAQQQYGDGP